MNFEVKMTEGAMDIIVNNVIKWGGEENTHLYFARSTAFPMVCTKIPDFFVSKQDSKLF